MFRSVRRLIEAVRVWRLEHRGDVVARSANALLLVEEIGGDLIPEGTHEIPRDLFGLLAFIWAATPERGVVHDPHEVLRAIRDRAWLGYTDAAALVKVVRTALPRSRTARRMISFFEELEAKGATYLFLPVVSRIDRHQSRDGAPPSGALRIDGFSERHAQTEPGLFTRVAFALAPEKQRERDLFQLALTLEVLAGGPDALQSPSALLRQTREQLWRLYCEPAGVLRALDFERNQSVSGGEAAQELYETAGEIAARAPWLWLEALFLVENWISGPQWFEHAFELEARPMHRGDPSEPATLK